MKNEIQVFNYQNANVRTVMINEEPWFVLKDVCEVLGIENPSYVRGRLDEDEVGSFDLPHPQNKMKMLEMVCINESGLYNVILRSDKPQAKSFRKWVTSEVIPSIRKTGSYSTTAPLLVNTSVEDALRDKMRTAKLISEFCGVNVTNAVVHAITLTEKETGADLSGWVNILPKCENPTPTLNATGVGKLIGVDPRKANILLAEAGFQIRDEEGDWRITKAGCEYGGEFFFSKNGHNDTQIRWYNKVADVLNA